MGPGVVAGGFRAWLEASLGLVFPEVCCLCETRRALASEGYVCTNCAGAPGHVVPVHDPCCVRCGLPYSGEVTSPFRCGNCAGVEFAFDWARASVTATPFLLGVIHRFKYGGARWLAPFLISLLARETSVYPDARDWDGVIPVPLHPIRERERGFNQAVILGTAMSRRLGIPLVKGCVVRDGATRVQASLQREERFANVEGVFSVPQRSVHRVDGRRFIIVDDVLTTGATTGAVAAVLREAGAAALAVWTLARGV